MIDSSVLRSMSCLDSLDDDAIKMISGIADRHSVSKGSIVQQEGSDSDALYIVESGRISIEMDMPGHGQISILTIQPGDLLGWSALVPPHIVTATSEALVDTTLIRIPRASLQGIFSENTTMKAAFYEMLAKRISVRLSESRKQMTYLLSTVN